ncbi:MAG TPA: hypothetical protein VF607_03780 [Verrucomicrobiae bacterium]
MIKSKSSHQTILTITAAILAVGSAQAYELKLNDHIPPVDFHGFLSQGFLASSDFNYLADNSKEGSFKFTEAGINASFNPFPRTRITAQGFMFDVGNVGDYHPFLDYASAEYTFNDEIGIRAGRIRRPAGIYNHIQDVDVARTFVLLPQGVYDARWRDWSAGLDGGELFGTISLNKLGSVAYEAYAGMVSMADNGGIQSLIHNGLPPGGTFNGIRTTPVFGGQLWYNTPVDGLRFGAAISFFDGFSYDITVPFPGKINAEGDSFTQQFSAEYTIKNWTFQVEYYTYTVRMDQRAAAFGGAKIGSIVDTPATWYTAASYRFNKYFEVGGYYTQYRDYGTAASNSDGHQNDFALCLRIDPKDWWTVKIEGHYLDGTGLLRDNAHNPIRDDRGWLMLALKTTFSF